MKYARCDDARENEDFEKACKQEGIGIQFKDTVPCTPQQNGCVERKFTILFNKLCVMLNSRKLFSFLRKGSWAEAANTSTLVEKKPLTLTRDLHPFQQFLGEVKRKILILMQHWSNVYNQSHNNSHWA